MPGQYFRDTSSRHAFTTYKKDSRSLADLNNEMGWKNPDFKANLLTLNSLTLLKFNQDQVVNPRESAWFESYSKKEKRMLPLREQELYKEDYIGLRALDESLGGDSALDDIEMGECALDEPLVPLSDRALEPYVPLYTSGDVDISETGTTADEWSPLPPAASPISSATSPIG